MKRKIIVIIMITSLTIILNIYNKNSNNELNSAMAIMVQNESNNTQYDPWMEETWPDEKSYQLNTDKSDCKGISFKENKIEIISNISQSCKLYFDKIVAEPLKIENSTMNENACNNLSISLKLSGGTGNYTYSLENYTCASSGCNSCYNYGSYNPLQALTITSSEDWSTISITDKIGSKHSYTLVITDSSNNVVKYDAKNTRSCSCYGGE